MIIGIIAGCVVTGLVSWFFYLLLKRIDTLEKIVETHNLCHNLHGTVDLEAFAEGCAQEQMKLYGGAFHADQARQLLSELRVLNALAEGDDHWIKECPVASEPGKRLEIFIRRVGDGTEISN